MDSNNSVRKKRSKLVVENGLCVLCAKRLYITTSSYKLCEICYVKRASTKNMNSRKYWKQLLDLLEQQDHICPYSGETIVLGQNDSIDHILPKSRFPALISDISNIQWVTRHINHMKWDMTHDEFMDTLQKIQRHCSVV